MPDAPYIFVSYSSTDSAFVSILTDDLERRGIRLWWDRHRSDGIQPAEDWEDKIQDKLQACTHIIVVITPKSVVSTIVRAEIQTAYEYKKIFIPIMLADVQKVPLMIKTVQYIDFRDPTTYEAKVRSLARFLLSPQPTQEATREFIISTGSYPQASPRSTRSNRVVWIGGITLAVLLLLVAFDLGTRLTNTGLNNPTIAAPPSSQTLQGTQLVLDSTAQPSSTVTEASTIAPTVVPPYLSVMYSKNFETDTLTDLYLPMPGWKIEADKVNPANHIFCITTEYRVWSQFYVANSGSWTDYSVEFRTQIKQFDDDDKDAGNVQVGLRMQPRPADGGAPSSYFAGLDAKKNNTFIQKWTKETNAIGFDYRAKPIATAQWYMMRGEIQGIKLRLFIDGELMREVTDTSLTSGAVGIQAAPNSTICVDDIVVRSLRKTLASTIDSERATLISEQKLLNDEGTAIANLATGTEVFILSKNDATQYVYVRDEATKYQGWLPASSIKLLS